MIGVWSFYFLLSAVLLSLKLIGIPLAAPPTMLPNHSSSLWAMADSWFPTNTQAKTSQQQQQNILSAPCSSSIPTEEEVAEGLRLFTESITEWYWDKYLDPQLDAVARSNLGEDYQGMCPHSPSNSQYEQLVLLCVC